MSFLVQKSIKTGDDVAKKIVLVKLVLEIPYDWNCMGGFCPKLLIFCSKAGKIHHHTNKRLLIIHTRIWRFLVVFRGFCLFCGFFINWIATKIKKKEFNLKEQIKNIEVKSLLLGVLEASIFYSIFQDKYKT